MNRDAIDVRVAPLVTKFATENHVPGTVFGIVADGRLAYLKTLGVQNIGSGTPVTTLSVFRIASMTKMFTALAVLQLRDRGLLQFETPVEDIVPELKTLRYPTRDSRRIRIRDLLSHAGGFVTDDPWGDRQLDMTAEQFSAFLAAGFPFARAPGVAYEYSNLGFAILGRVIENASGQSYPAYMAEHFLAPLKLSSTGYEVADVPADRRAVGYSWIDEAWVEQPALGHGAFGAMGGLHTNAEDYARFVAWLLSAWPPRDDPDDPVLPRASMREIAQGDGFPILLPPARPVAEKAEQSRRYGLGIIAIADRTLGLCLTHSGGLPGYGSNVLFLPDRGLGLFLFANVTYPHPGAAATVWQAAVDLVGSGAFPARSAPPLPDLSDLEDKLRRIYAARDITAGGDILAMNLLLDRDAGHWNRDLATLSTTLGDITGAGVLTAESALAGTFVFLCEHHRLRVHVLLAPTRPARIQDLDFAAIERDGAD